MKTERECFVRGLKRFGIGLVFLVYLLVVFNIIGYLSWKYDIMIFTNRYNFPQYDSYMVRAMLLSILGLGQTLVCSFGVVLAAMLCVAAYRATSWAISTAYHGILHLSGYRKIQ